MSQSIFLNKNIDELTKLTYLLFRISLTSLKFIPLFPIY